MTPIFQQFRDAYRQDATQIIAVFDNIKGWEGKYRQIMLFGKQLPALASQYRLPENLVEGCESQVWLHIEQDSSDGCYYFAADSDARIIKGLVSLILLGYNGKNAAEIAQFDIEGYFTHLDLLKHLSPSRANGVHAIIQRIKRLT